MVAQPMVAIIALAGLGALTSIAAADDTTFVVENATDVGIAAIYASPAHLPDWPPSEPLPHSAIPARTSVTISIANGACAYDFRFAFDDGSNLDDSTDVCEIGTYIVTR